MNRLVPVVCVHVRGVSAIQGSGLEDTTICYMYCVGAGVEAIHTYVCSSWTVRFPYLICCVEYALEALA